MNDIINNILNYHNANYQRVGLKLFESYFYANKLLVRLKFLLFHCLQSELYLHLENRYHKKLEYTNYRPKYKLETYLLNNHRMFGWN